MCNSLCFGVVKSGCYQHFLKSSGWELFFQKGEDVAFAFLLYFRTTMTLVQFCRAFFSAASPTSVYFRTVPFVSGCCGIELQKVPLAVLLLSQRAVGGRTIQLVRDSWKPQSLDGRRVQFKGSLNSVRLFCKTNMLAPFSLSSLAITSVGCVFRKHSISWRLPILCT